MEPVFKILLVSAVAFFVVFLVYNLFFNQEPKEENEEEEDPIYCNHENCNETVNLTTKDKKIKACVKFYSSVCDKRSKTHKLQMTTEAYINQNSKMLNILNNSDEPIKCEADSVVRRFHSICLKQNPGENDLKTILDIFSSNGGFPVLDGYTFDDSKWSWLETTRKLRGLGLFTDSLFTTKLGSNPVDLENTTFYITNPRLDLALKDYCGRGDECMVSFVFEFVEVVMKFGAVREVAVVDGMELFNLEKKLLNMIWENPTASKESLAKDQLTTLASLSSSFGFVNWTEYLTILLGSQEYIKKDLVVVVENAGYLSSLKLVLENTPKRLLANFMMWSMLCRIQEYIPGYKRNALECFNFLKSTMSYAMQSMYVNTIKLDDKSSGKVVLEIATKIREELLKRVRSSKWMSNETRKEIVKKVERIEFIVGYPQILLNSTFVNEYYENISISDNALESMIAVQKFHVDRYYNLCCRRAEEIFWDLSVRVFLPLVYYDSAQNSIHVLQGALQDPIFNTERSMSENFGILGSMIAHEMIHALDSIGYRYNADGKRKSSCDDEYLAAFEDKSKCFVDQYNRHMNFTAELLFQNPLISGEFKKLEIVADSIAVDLSFTAYKSYENDLYLSEKKVVDGNFTMDHMFFQTFAQFYCIQYSEGELFQVLLDDHAPNPYRVDGALWNSQDFGKAYNCESGSKMNPKKKCSMW